MKAPFRYTPVLALALLAGCTSTSKVLREPPKEGVAVAGINVLYVIVPLNFIKKTYGGFGRFGDKAPRPATRDEMKDPQDHAEHLRDQLSERLLPQLQMAGIRTEFASHQVVPGISPTPIGTLFPSSHQDLHLLVITPISESTVCNPTCTTLVKLKLPLFHGHLTVMEKGVRNAQNQATLRGGIPSADHRAGARRQNACPTLA